MADVSSPTGRRPSRISPTTYGGQAVMEGVMMRGRRWASVAVRSPSKQIVIRSERLPVHLYAGWISKTPFLRGLTVLWDSLGLGMKALMFSAEVAEQPADATAPGDQSADTESAALASDAPGTKVNQGNTFGQTLQWTTVAVALLFGVGVFFLLPLGAAALFELAVPNNL